MFKIYLFFKIHVSVLRLDFDYLGVVTHFK